MITIKYRTVAFSLLLCAPLAVAQSHVPSLQSSLSELTPDQREVFDSNITSAGSLSENVGRAIDQAQVGAALEQGLITQAEAADLNSALSIIEANADKFNFDVNAALTEALASGEVSAAEIAAITSAFSNLSEAGQSIVGQEAFGSDTPEGQALYESLSDVDRAIVDSVEPPQ